MKLKAFKISEELRRELSKPWGLVLTNDEIASGKLEEIIESMRPTQILTVGDVTTWVFLERGLKPRVALIDMRTLRGPYEMDLTKRMRVACEMINPPGHIVSIAEEIISEAVKRGGLVVVKGEEDLLVIPSILTLPEGAVIAYGQPNIGVVLIRVDEEKKRKAKEILGLMSEVEIDVSTVPS
ncbi:MAG: DUF359 domain-containing protein [Candidatus Nezhaarchaeota archaeon]|nr:DUF359 domain-containing protein [Candidatus Nezhaarchaeota archaeon]MCX8141805.1 DUF359 domain-containing protein [Candidatus Nezhaarchaeota archaeon]MDW8050414.1 DUF359 domain-containing protein [Nitrososphaerota archaeon]